MNLNNLDYWDRKDLSTRIDDINRIAAGCTTYEQLKCRISAKYRGDIKRIVLRYLSGTEAKNKEFNRRAADCLKLVNSVKKDIKAVDKKPVTLDFYFWPVAATEYSITTTKGAYKFTVPASIEISIPGIN